MHQNSNGNHNYGQISEYPDDRDKECNNADRQNNLKRGRGGEESNRCVHDGHRDCKRHYGQGELYTYFNLSIVLREYDSSW